MNFEEVYPDTINSISAAAAAGDLKRLNELLASGQVSFAHDNRGWKAIHFAASHGHVECLKILMRQELCDKNWQTFDGSSALKLACEELPKTLDVVHYLLEQEVDVSLKDDRGMTALHYACSSKCLKAVKWLTRCGSQVNAMNIWNQTPLHCLVEKNTSGHLRLRTPEPETDEMLEIASYLIKHGADIHLRDERELNPFTQAIVKCCFKLAEVILNSCKENEREKYVNEIAGSFTPLAIVCMLEEVSYDFVEILLDAGANPNISHDEDRLLPLEIACQGSNAQVIERLLEVTNYRRKNPASFNSFIHPLRLAFSHSDVAVRTLLDFPSSPFLVPDRDLVEIRCPCHMSPFKDCGLSQDVYDVQYKYQTLLSLCLSESPLRTSKFLRELAKRKWSLNSDRKEVIPPLTAFANEASNEDMNLECCEKIFKIFSDFDEQVSRQDTFLFVIFTPVYMLSLALEHSLLNVEDFNTLSFNRFDKLFRDPEILLYRKRLIAQNLFHVILLADKLNFKFIHKRIILRILMTNSSLGMQEAIKCLERVEKNPKSLMSFARKTLRKYLHKYSVLNKKSVQRLQIPKILHQYMLFQTTTSWNTKSLFEFHESIAEPAKLVSIYLGIPECST